MKTGKMEKNTEIIASFSQLPGIPQLAKKEKEIIASKSYGPVLK